MYLSVARDASKKYPNEYDRIAVANWSVVAKVATTCRWSPIIWQDGRRKGDNYQGSHFAVLDIDDGLTLTEALTFLYQHSLGHVVVTTKSHQMAKGSEPAIDRFRIIMLWSREIIKPSEYTFNLRKLAQSWAADRAATDLARVFQPGRDIVSIRSGQKVWVNTVPKPSRIAQVRSAIATKNGVRRFAREFLECGRLDSSGGRKRTIYSVACELSKSGLGSGEVERMILSAPISWQGIPQATVQSIVLSAQRRFSGR